MPETKIKTGYLYENHELKKFEYQETPGIEHSGNKIKRKKRRMVKKFFKRFDKFCKVAWKFLNQDIEFKL